MAEPGTVAARLLRGLDQEAANTRRMLERVPDDHLQWRPHPKSMRLAELATHIASLPGAWAARTGVPSLGRDSFDLASPEAAAQRPAPVTSLDELLRHFDASVAALREALATASDDRLRGTFTLRYGERVIFTLPTVAVLRTHVLHHTIHHRAQLGVYLRLLDVPVPGMYGPSADERG